MATANDDARLAKARAITERLAEAPARQFREALKAAPVELIEPSADEARNGWTAETLTAYVAEQTAAQALRIDPHSALRRVKPMRANSRYRPTRWRG